MRRTIIHTLLILLSIDAYALKVSSSSGNLSTQIPDKSITSLEVTGTINALDFKFIADSLPQLNDLDISECKIEAFSSNKPVFVNARTFADNTIPAACFAGSGISKITLPNTTKAIGESAFFGCANLENITLPESIDSIAPYAFSSCQRLQSIVIPSAVTSIGAGAFSHCPALSTIKIDDTNRSTNIEIGNEAFLDCPALTGVALGKYVSRIGAKAFSGCNNEAFHISIEGNALKEIGEGAFMNSGIKGFDFSVCPSLTAIPEYAFANSAMASASITDNITHIAEGAFFYNTSLKDINLGECSSSISPLQFAGCKNANTTGITSSTSEIGNYSYYGWEQLHKLVLPEAVSNIGDYAFAQMTSLEKITSTNLTAPGLGDKVFSGITPSAVLLTTKFNANGYKTAEQWKDFMHTLNGDADNSKEININDITTVISNICGKSQKNFLFEAADANVDEKVDETDITTIVDTIMGNSNTISDK